MPEKVGAAVWHLSCVAAWPRIYCPTTLLGWCCAPAERVQGGSLEVLVLLVDRVDRPCRFGHVGGRRGHGSAACCACRGRSEGENRQRRHRLDAREYRPRA